MAAPPPPPPLSAPAPAPVADLSPLSVAPAFESPTTLANGSDQFTAFPAPEHEEAQEDLDDGMSHHLTSAASMATEILSVSPEIDDVTRSGTEESDAQESELISKDVTLIARGRRKRFRLH